MLRREDLYNIKLVLRMIHSVTVAVVNQADISWCLGIWKNWLTRLICICVDDNQRKWALENIPRQDLIMIQTLYHNERENPKFETLFPALISMGFIKQIEFEEN
ncbi:MAG: hypothetical protein H8D23_18620 [Candidatus Brocadiales bacterium]|nr:hypothetical protein [Candidatus Brocadiales bacterium]